MVTLARKKVLADRFENLISSYEAVMLFKTSNIDNYLMSQIKSKVLSETSGVFLHGRKACFIKRCHQLKEKNPNLEKLIPYLKGDIIIYFTSEDECMKVSNIVSQFTRTGQAKYGLPALNDCWIEPQLTKIPASNTKVFQKLRIPTAITKGTLEITNKYQILEEGVFVNQMQIDILNLLKIMPYVYQAKLHAVFTSGDIIDKSFFGLKPEDFTKNISESVSKANSLAFGSSFPMPVVLQAALTQNLKDLTAFALSVSDKFEIPEFKEKFAILNDPEAMKKLQDSQKVISAVAVESKDEKANQKPAEEEEEDDSEMSEMDMNF
ncbi:MAG: 60S acidic ribosomal protein P0 [Paramarteilia canceri]